MRSDVANSSNQRRVGEELRRRTGAHARQARRNWLRGGGSLELLWWWQDLCLRQFLLLRCVAPVVSYSVGPWRGRLGRLQKPVRLVGDKAERGAGAGLQNRREGRGRSVRGRLLWAPGRDLKSEGRLAASRTVVRSPQRGYVCGGVASERGDWERWCLRAHCACSAWIFIP